MHKKNIFKKLTTFKNPITMEKFIKLSLYDQEGYYSNSNIIGSSGDFITSPEISQLFGEILGLYILNYWQKNIKKKFNLIELGPGKGTLLLDIIKITEKFNNFNEAVSVKLIEKNTNLINKQKTNFNKFNFYPKKISWHKDFKSNNIDPVILIANEFFDCFPIRQFYKKNDTWYEKKIKFNSTEQMLKIKDIEIKNQKTINCIKSYNPLNTLEISKSREKYFSKICKHILQVGGLMITIDYGYLEKPKNFTLQSIYKNKSSYVLDNIGYQDITSLVDFKSLISIAKYYNLKINIFSSQRDFLIKHGIYERGKKLLTNCKTHQKEIIKNGLNRIIDIKNMGTIFKVLVVSK